MYIIYVFYVVHLLVVKKKECLVNGIVVLLNYMWKQSEILFVQKWLTKSIEWNNEQWISRMQTKFRTVLVAIDTDMTSSHK
jgi:hypothetical protein